MGAFLDRIEECRRITQNHERVECCNVQGICFGLQSGTIDRFVGLDFVQYTSSSLHDVGEAHKRIFAER